LQNPTTHEFSPETLDELARKLSLSIQVFEPPDYKPATRGQGTAKSTSDEVPAPFWADTRRGIRLYRGDALDLLRRSRSGLFDVIFADPPYFLSNNGITCQNGKMVSVNKGTWDKASTFEAMHAFNLEWLRECHRLLKPNGTIWVTGTSHNIHSVGFAMQTLGYKILNDIAWYKVNPPPNLACRYFTHATESILWARRNDKARHLFHYDTMKRDNGGKQMQSLWHIKPPGRDEKRFGKHPTQKPEALLDRILRASSNPGDLVLDPFCGSATTGVVCARLQRKFVGFDLEKTYLELAVRRVEGELQAQPRLFVYSLRNTEVSTDVVVEPDVPRPKTWNEIVWNALQELGGQACLREINEVVQHHPRTRRNPTWPCTIRRVVRQPLYFEATGRGKYRNRLDRKARQ
jgi:site-specific DNA-methyltransferase (adenine-specific)